MAEGEGFEPSIRYNRIPDFESGAFDHSATLPHSGCPKEDRARMIAKERRKEKRRFLRGVVFAQGDRCRRQEFGCFRTRIRRRLRDSSPVEMTPSARFHHKVSPSISPADTKKSSPAGIKPAGFWQNRVGIFRKPSRGFEKTGGGFPDNGGEFPEK